MCERCAAIGILLALILPTAALADDASRRDPLKPPGEVRTTSTDTFDAGAWRLASTLVADGRQVAIINDRAVRVGERVGGARVIAIESGRVELEYRGRRFAISRPAAAVNKR